MGARALAVVGLLLLGSGATDAGERITMRVSPAVAFAPANLVVRMMIANSDENRSMEIIAESADFYRSSEVQLDGDRAPRTTILEFRSLPSGAYDVTAILKGTAGRELAAVQQKVSIMDGLTQK